MIGPQNLLGSQLRAVEVFSLEPVIGTIRIGCTVEPCALGRHAAQQHLKEALRHEADFIAERNSDGQATNVPLRTLILGTDDQPLDRKSTRLNSSHLVISYAVFC